MRIIAIELHATSNTHLTHERRAPTALAMLDAGTYTVGAQIHLTTMLA